jgi:HAD superfamily hydrolase (TIGR01509 family)
LKIAAVILDVDGTLVDSNDAHTRAWVDAFAAEGVTVAYDEVRRAIGMGGDNLMPTVSEVEDSSELGKRITKKRSEIFRERELPRLQAFPGVRALADAFVADGFVLVVASSAKEDELQPLLEIAGIAELVGKRASSDDAKHSKPEPDIVTAALEQVKAEPADAIMLGDTPYDVQAALKAGVAIVALECGGWSREELKGAAAVYADAADLLANYDSSPFAALRSGEPVPAS